MKCDFFQECETAKNLVIDIDLRVDKQVRIADIAKRLLPLNDKIGEVHISANLAYNEQGQSKHTNLPAYAIETDEERIFCILFPTETYATIWQNPGYRSINLLEYHIDKHTEVITEVSDAANTNNQVIYGFPIEGGTEMGEQANVDATLLLPLTQLLQAIDNNIPTVVISTDGYYVRYNIKRTPDGQSWQGVVGKIYFTEDSDGNVGYNNQYYQFTPGFEGKLSDVYTRFLKQRTLANKNNTVQKVDLNISSKTATTNVIDNTAGTGVTLDTATASEAGLMSADDRQKMTLLFDGSLLSKDTPAGYHKHNYLEMADLPQTIELSAATYGEFKAAVIKLQTEVIAKGKYGKITQTGNWVRNDNEVFDLTNIEISNPTKRSIEVTTYPLKLTGRCQIEYLYLLYPNNGNGYIRNDNILMLEFIEKNTYDFMDIDTLHLTNCFGKSNTTTTSVVKISKNPKNATGTAVTVEINHLLGYTLQNTTYGERPLVIETDEFSERLTFKLSGNEFPSDKKTYLKLNNIPKKFGLDLIVDSSLFLESNLSITNSIKQIQKKFNDLKEINGLVPYPSAVQKNANFFLNALGEWVDITTLIGK